MTGFNLYRIFVIEDYRERLYELIISIRPEESKVQCIRPEQGMLRIELAISEEELAFIKLGIPFACKEVWIQEWPSK
jgi:hypothetical protein